MAKQRTDKSRSREQELDDVRKQLPDDIREQQPQPDVRRKKQQLEDFRKQILKQLETLEATGAIHVLEPPEPEWLNNRLTEAYQELEKAMHPDIAKVFAKEIRNAQRIVIESQLRIVEELSRACRKLSDLLGHHAGKPASKVVHHGGADSLGDSLEEYFDRLNAAFAALESDRGAAKHSLTGYGSESESQGVDDAIALAAAVKQETASSVSSLSRLTTQFIEMSRELKSASDRLNEDADR